MRGLFVTFEGIDRSGKTTQAGLLVDALGDEALGVREPGGTPAGEKVRELLKDPAVALSPEAEALLFVAARSELVAEVILPALENGKVVVSDQARLVARLPGRRSRSGHRGGGARTHFAVRGLKPDRRFSWSCRRRRRSADGRERLDSRTRGPGCRRRWGRPTRC